MTRSIGSPPTTGADSSGMRRARILAVGHPAAMPGLDDASDRPIVQVSNLFDAVGELCTARPNEPIDAVLIAQAQAVAATTRSLQLLRRFDPAVQFVLVSSGEGRELEASIRELFDHQLTTPLTRSMIEAIFTGGGAAELSPCEAERVGEIEIDRHAGMNGHGEPAPSEALQTSPNTEESAAPSPPVEVPDEPLGDIDLVEAVMHEPNGVRERAVALIAQQTGWSGVELLAEPATRGIAVVRDDVFHGTLVADAPREELEPWAEWLGYWMTLDAAYRTNRTLSLTDELTGAWNRRYFDSFLDDCIRRAAGRRRPVSVMVLDLDDFKVYNDTFGHAAGDEILRETVRLLTSVIRSGDRVCRIGGDEFAVIFADIEGPREQGSDHPHSVEQITKRFQDEICQMHFPKLGIEAPGTLSVSAGLATYPWDGHDARSLLEHADQLALESKRRGKNAITMGPGAQETCGKH